MAKPHQRLILLSLGCGAVALATVLGLRAQRFPAEAAADPSGSFPLPPQDQAPAPPAGWGSSTSPATPEGPIVALPSDPSLRRVGDGRHYPLVPSDPSQVAQLLVAVEEALRSSFTDPAELPALGHQQQVIYRVLSHKTALANQVRPSIPPRWLSVYDRHLAARREFLAMHRGGKKPDTLPAWRIVQPEPPENLIRYYKQAEQATGIEWEVLAAVNLVETGMGRIDGVSVANAQGPMQFLPTTWAEAGIGKGNIRDPHDAIQAAARYLVRRGGLKDIRKGLWGYNNSDHYGRAVLLYASMIKEDPRAYTGLYHWEIHFGSAAGDLWLPVGYNQPQRISIAAYLAEEPASAPPRGSSGY